MTGRQAHTTAAVSIAAVRIRKIAVPPDRETESATLSPLTLVLYFPRASYSLGLSLTACVFLVISIENKIQDPSELQHASHCTNSKNC